MKHMEKKTARTSASPARHHAPVALVPVFFLVTGMLLSVTPVQADTTVYVTATGSKYHLSTRCRGLRNAKSTRATTLSAAQAAGYAACAICAGGAAGGGRSAGSSGVTTEASQAATNEVVVSETDVSQSASEDAITLEADKAVILKGKTTTLRLRGVGSSKTVKWKSSNKKVLQLQGKGKKATVKGKKAGKATVTATVDGHSYKCRIKVSKKRLSVNKTTLTMLVGEEATVTVKLKGDEEDELDVSTKEELISWEWGDWKGNKVPLVITAEEAGTETVTIENELTEEKIRIAVVIVDPFELLEETTLY